MAPRATVPLREIVYTLSPYNQEIVMQGVANYPGKIAKFFKNNFTSMIIFGAVFYGPILYSDAYIEREKIESRY